MTHSLGHPLGAGAQAAGGQIGGGGEEGTGAQEAPDAHAADDLVGDGLDLLVRIADLVVLGILGVDLGKVRAAVEHDGDQLGHGLFVKHNTFLSALLDCIQCVHEAMWLHDSIVLP